MQYYLGRWRGVVNGTLLTELQVLPEGQFVVRSQPHPKQRSCELNGRFRAEARKIFLDVAESTCSTQSIGTTLEREVIDRGADSFTVVSPSGDLQIEYSRQP